MAMEKRLLVCATALLIVGVLASSAVDAHGVSDKDALFLSMINGPAVGPLMYLGAKHMVTGYDHLLFLVGVIFFLYRMRDVAVYVTLFSIGHSITLLAGVLMQINVDPYLVDALIGLSVVYKAFDNLGGFRTLFGVEPDNKAAVAIFGLIHGFGLATKVQALRPSPDGLLTNMLSFNVGVEVGQLLALSIILIAMTWWRSTASFSRLAVGTNVLLMVAGFALAGQQLAGYFYAPAA
jgi:hypothetical protein